MSDTSATRAALGTSATVIVATPRALEAARRTLDTELHAIDAACSRFRPDSELSRVNANPGRATQISPLFVEAMEVALRAAHMTDGIVDPTVGSVLRQLGYDRDFATVTRDGPALRVRVTTVPGWRTIMFHADAGTVMVPHGVELDFGATAKALCADRAARAAAARTNTGVLVALGGDIAIAGPPPAGGWPVRVADDHAARTGGQTIALLSGGLATSGTTRRRWQRGGVELHHLVDSRTGRPALSPWRTVSVAAASCVDANIASTAAIVLGDRAPCWLAERELPARMVAVDGTVRVVAGWPAVDLAPVQGAAAC
jgi:thiamine biosynthesis lipoprotein